MPLSPSTIFAPSENITWDFEGQVVLVTGAAHGQGAAHAKAFAEAGAHVAISDIGGEMEYIDYPLGTVHELEEVAHSVRAAGGRCLSSVCDVRRPDQVGSFVERTMTEFGRIDIAISNAGVGSCAPFVDMPQAQWAETLDTDLSGSFYVCKYVASHMIAAQFGRIIVTGSTASFGGLSNAAPYTASKHGVLGLVKGFASELAPHGVTINLVCPTAVDTWMNEPFARGESKCLAWNAEATRLVGAWNLLHEGMIHEREISEAIMWLASRDASRISGTALMVDAGCTCK